MWSNFKESQVQCVDILLHVPFKFILYLPSPPLLLLFPGPSHTFLLRLTASADSHYAAFTPTIPHTSVTTQ